MTKRVLTNEKYKEICLQYDNMLFGIMSRFPSLKEDWRHLKDLAIVRAWNGFDKKRRVKFITFLNTCMFNECRSALNVSKSHNKIFLKRHISQSKEHFQIKGEKRKREKEKAEEQVKDLPLQVLSKKEKKIIKLKLLGYTGEEIAEKLDWKHPDGKFVSYKRVHQVFQVACEKLRIASEYRHYYRPEDYPIYRTSEE